MIRITVEMIPHGDERKSELFAVAEIWLDKVSPDGKVGNYIARLSHTGKWYKPGKWWMTGAIKGFKRLKETPWMLITMALAAACMKKRR